MALVLQLMTMRNIVTPGSLSNLSSVLNNSSNTSYFQLCNLNIIGGGAPLP